MQLVDPCIGPAALVCHAGGAAAAGAVDAVYQAMGNAFVTAAQPVVAVTFAALEATTRIDLSAAWLRANLAVLAAVSLPIIVGLVALHR